jgi:hypothetical protein
MTKLTIARAFGYEIIANVKHVFTQSQNRDWWILLALEIAPKQVQTHAKKVTLIWNDGHKSVYSLKRLQKY